MQYIDGLPGFLRGCPDAVSRGAGDDPFAGVLAAVTPTPVDSRIVEFGVPCSGECGGELKLPGEDASFASMAEEHQTTRILQCALRR
jgi:hypothetical protein